MLTDNEVDKLMEKVHPQSRRWCPVFGEPPYLYPERGCACLGCVVNIMSFDEFDSWRNREANRDETPYTPQSIELTFYNQPPPTKTLQERLAEFKAKKRRAIGEE